MYTDSMKWKKRDKEESNDSLNKLGEPSARNGTTCACIANLQFPYHIILFFISIVW